MLDDREKQLKAEMLCSQTALFKIKKLRESMELIDRMQKEYLIQPSPHVMMCFLPPSIISGLQASLPLFSDGNGLSQSLRTARFSFLRIRLRPPTFIKKGFFGFRIGRQVLQQWPLPWYNPEMAIPSRLCAYTAHLIARHHLRGEPRQRL